MTRYLVELYLSRADSDGLAAAATMAREGHPVRWLRTIFVPEDETCFYLFEAASAELVRTAGERAGIPFQRVLAATETELPTDVRSAGSAGA